MTEYAIPNGDLISAFDEEAPVNAVDGPSGETNSEKLPPVRERNVFSSK